MQHDNNIENKLREMEGMDQPDLSQMNAHWQQMQAMLQPAALPAQNGWPKWMLNGFYAAVVVMMIGAAVWFLALNKNTANDSSVSKNTTADTAKINVAIVVGDTIKQHTNDIGIKESTATSTKKISINPSLILDDMANGNPMQWTDQDSILGTIKLKVTDCGTCPGKTDSAGTVSNAERQMKLQSLFSQLEKEEQHFSIDNSSDTLLQFREGTVLLVPANSFGGMKGIELTAKEFYKMSDIVLNQLNTASNKEQLVTGGMLELKAGYMGDEVKLGKDKSLVLFMPDTSNAMKGMQLFYREQVKNEDNRIGKDFKDTSSNANSSYSSNNFTWKPQQQFFMRRMVSNEVRVFNIADEPYKIKNTRNGKIGYFIIGEDNVITKKELKKTLKEKYGYYKVKLRSNFRNYWIWGNVEPNADWSGDRTIGDSVWMEEWRAGKHRLNIGERRTRVSYEYAAGYINTRVENFVLKPKVAEIAKDLKYQYGVNLDKLGWINCDRFYADSRKKINYKVDLGDEATNYYTMLVFDNIKSMMTGYIIGNTVAFQNIPVGEPVKIISIGINQNGETVYSVTNTTTSEQELKGLQFQTTSAPELKTSLSKLDK